MVNSGIGLPSDIPTSIFTSLIHVMKKITVDLEIASSKFLVFKNLLTLSRYAFIRGHMLEISFPVVRIEVNTAHDLIFFK